MTVNDLFSSDMSELRWAQSKCDYMGRNLQARMFVIIFNEFDFS